MKFGTLQGVLKEPLETVFATAARLGFDGVELDWSAAEDARGDGKFAAGQRAAIRERARQAGVEISSVAAHFLNAGGLGSAEPTMRETGLAAVREGIGLCADLGARVLLVPFFGAGELKGGADTEQLVRYLQALAPEAEARGVRLGVESTLPAREVARLVDEVGSAWVGSYWDMGNAMWLGYDDIEEIDTLGERIVAVHVKEFAGAPRAAPDTAGGRNATLETGAFGDPLGSASKALGVLRGRC
jgi:hexulose-6-phosphate isomerase